MNNAIKQSTTQYGSVSKFPTKVNAETAFKIFLMNLYYKLECNDSAFIDIMRNKNSNVTYLEYNRFTGYVVNGPKQIMQRLNQFQGSLSGHRAKELFNEFCSKNKISKKVG